VDTNKIGDTVAPYTTRQKITRAIAAVSGAMIGTSAALGAPDLLSPQGLATSIAALHSDLVQFIDRVPAPAVAGTNEARPAADVEARPVAEEDAPVTVELPAPAVQLAPPVPRALPAPIDPIASPMQLPVPADPIAPPAPVVSLEPTPVAPTTPPAVAPRPVVTIDNAPAIEASWPSAAAGVVATKNAPDVAALWRSNVAQELAKLWFGLSSEALAALARAHPGFERDGTMVEVEPDTAASVAATAPVAASAPAATIAAAAPTAATPAGVATATPERPDVAISTVTVPQLVLIPLPTPRPPPTPAQRLGLEGKDRVAAERCLAQAIYFEARAEPVRGQIAVAQVVMNRVFSPYYPKDVCSVVYQNAHRHLSCQFTFACDGKPETINERGAWARAQRIAKQTLDARLWLDDVAKSTHYHATYVAPIWRHEMKKMVKHGVHIFYRPWRWGDGAEEPGWGMASVAAATKKIK
jgi:hypothetical protein